MAVAVVAAAVAVVAVAVAAAAGAVVVLVVVVAALLLLLQPPLLLLQFVQLLQSPLSLLGWVVGWLVFIPPLLPGRCAGESVSKRPAKITMAGVHLRSSVRPTRSCYAREGLKKLIWEE